jgi:uncharacterized repeat protein (TIGR03809 family)
MTYSTPNLRDYHVSRWRKLAEQRLEHITELFATGRWRRYYNEPDFIEIVRQTKEAAAAWRRLDVPPLETPMPRRPSLSFAFEAKTPAKTSSAPESGIVGLLAPHTKLEALLEETELVSVAAVARPTLRLPSPFEDAVATTALQRAARL